MLGYDSVCFMFRLYYAAVKRGMGGRERGRETGQERWMNERGMGERGTNMIERERGRVREVERERWGKGG